MDSKEFVLGLAQQIKQIVWAGLAAYVVYRCRETIGRLRRLQIGEKLKAQFDPVMGPRPVIVVCPPGAGMTAFALAADQIILVGDPCQLPPLEQAVGRITRWYE
jgi:hypothetical protein